MVRSTLMADASWFSDAAKLREEGIDLTYGDLDSGRAFWTAILLIASRDHAVCVQFRPSLGDDCLSLTVANFDYLMAPPDAVFRAWLLRVARDLSAGSAWKGVLSWWKAHLLRCSSKGPLTLVCGGERFQWTGIFSLDGIVFQRRVESDEYERAIACYTGHIQGNPQYTEAYGARGWAYLMTGDLDNAIADSTAAIRLDPRSAADYYNRSCAYRKKGDKAKADEDFAQAKKLGYKEK